jgi:prepilin-type N-terminal cleavage/methylation domain-containing protein
MKTLNRITKRSGVTLTEVLMSLMIMSIGISAVAVLFPISVLRSVQATQLTNAAILKRNAQALLDMRQELVFDPDGDGNFDEHIGAQQELNYIVDPSGYFEMATGAAFSTASYATFATLSPSRFLCSLDLTVVFVSPRFPQMHLWDSDRRAATRRKHEH